MVYIYYIYHMYVLDAILQQDFIHKEHYLVNGIGRRKPFVSAENAIKSYLKLLLNITDIWNRSPEDSLCRY